MRGSQPRNTRQTLIGTITIEARGLERRGRRATSTGARPLTTSRVLVGKTSGATAAHGRSRNRGAGTPGRCGSGIDCSCGRTVVIGCGRLGLQMLEADQVEETIDLSLLFCFKFLMKLCKRLGLLRGLLAWETLRHRVGWGQHRTTGRCRTDGEGRRGTADMNGLVDAG